MSDLPPSPIGSDPPLTAQQVAEFLGASLRTIQRRIADNSIRSIKLGRIVRIPASEVGRLLDGSWKDGRDQHRSQSDTYRQLCEPSTSNPEAC